MTKKDDKAKDETPVLGTGAYGDVKDPAAGAPVSHEVFEPAPVEAPEKIEKEETK